jgi:hypothetical protein
MNADFILTIVGLVCFALAALNVPARVALVPLGLFFVTLTLLV